MNKRWYDMHPTLSMAISLLQNAPIHHRHQAISYVGDIIRELYPGVTNRITLEPGGFWSINFIHKRRSMDEKSWTLLETLRYLPDADKELMGIELIRYIYCLENEESHNSSFTGMSQYGAAI